MALYTDQTVEVNVFLESAPTTSQSFEFPLIAIPHNLTSNNIDSFSSISSVTAAGAAINSPLYMFATGLFGGIAAPSLMKVARADITETTMTVESIPAEGEDISLNVNINGVSSVISYTILGGDTTTTVATALTGLLDTAYPSTDPNNPTFASSVDVITATFGATTYPSTFGWNSFVEGTLAPHIVVSDKTSDSLVTVLQTALSEDDNVAFLMAESHDSADITAIANFAQSSERYQYKTSTSDVNAADSGNTSNIAYSLSLLAQNKVELMLHSKAETHFPEAAVIGGQANLSPYQVQTVNLLELPSIPVDNWTETQKATLAARNTNFYVSERDVGTYREGWSMSSQFSDLIRFSLWMKETIEQSLFDLLRSRVNSGRALPYNSASARSVESTIQNNVIRLGLNGGTIATGFETNSQGQRVDYSPIVNFGNRSDQTTSNIANRIWADGVVEVVYQASIHHLVPINVYVVNNREPQ